MHVIPIPPEGVHTVRAVPTIINALMDKEEPSLLDLATWANQYYNGNHLNIRQINDGDILQVLNGLHLSGLLEHENMGGGTITLSDSEGEEDHAEGSNDEGTPSSETSNSDEEIEEEDGDSSGSSSSA